MEPTVFVHSSEPDQTCPFVWQSSQGLATAMESRLTHLPGMAVEAAGACPAGF